MRRTATAALTVGIALGAVVAAPMAGAYDKQAYSYAAMHMPDAKDIPKALGTFKTNMSFNASSGDEEIYLCSLPDSNAQVTGPRHTFAANYNTKKRSPNSVGVVVYQFKSNTDAIKGFRALNREARKCTGTQSNSSTGDDGVTYSWSSSLSNGKVPDVKVVGVESIFINSDYVSGSSDEDREFLSDTYTVYSLVNDVIIATSYYANNAASLTRAQKRAVNQLAFNAIGTWVD